MSSHFIKLTYRHFKNDRLYSSLNLLGILCGIVGAAVLTLFILKEYGYDKFLKNHDRIYRITTVFSQAGQENRFALNEGLWDDVLANEVSGVEASTAFLQVYGGGEFTAGDRSLFADRGLYADSDFLKVFDFPILYGQRDFADPNSIIVSRSLAVKLFGRPDVAGEIVGWTTGPHTSISLKIAAVLGDIPDNSSIQFDFVIPGVQVGSWWVNQFNNTHRSGNTLYVYFKTFTHEPVAQLQSKIDKAFAKDKPDIAGFEYRTPVQSLDDVHFNSDNQFELKPGGNKEYVNLFVALTIAFTIITLLNALNLNSVRALKRVKEVVIRRLFGGRIASISKYFLLESVLTAVLSCLVAFVISELVLSNVDLGFFSISPQDLLKPGLVVLLLIYSLFLGLIISVPFSRVTSTSIIAGLKGKTGLKRQGLFGAKNIVVVIQLVAAVCTVTFSLIVFRQINYLKTLDLGYEKENALVLSKPPSVSEDLWHSFENSLVSFPEIDKAGGSGVRFLGLDGMSNAQFSPEHGSAIIASWNAIDADFMQATKMQLVDGKALSQYTNADSSGLFINESASAELGDGGNVGRKLKTWFGTYRILGVIKDFYFRPFNNRISPVVFWLNPSDSRFMYVHYEAGAGKRALKDTQQLWRQLSNGIPISYEYLEDNFNNLMKDQLQSSRVLIFFTTLCIATMIIGLIGLLGFTLKGLRKEIAIRKIVGGSTRSIIYLLSSRYLLLLLTSLCFSIPASILFARYWLADFVYKTSVGYSNIVTACLWIPLICFLLVIHQVYLSAKRSPVAELRVE